MQQLAVASNQSSDIIQSLSILLIVFGTVVASLALPVVRRRLSEQLDSTNDYFFGDRKKEDKRTLKTEFNIDSTNSDHKTSRKEIDNFDLDIFKDF